MTDNFSPTCADTSFSDVTSNSKIDIYHMNYSHLNYKTCLVVSVIFRIAEIKQTIFTFKLYLPA